MKYYLVSRSVDEKVIGSEYYQMRVKNHKTHPDFSNEKFIDVDEPWGFILEDGAILTDVIYTGSFTARGFFINEKVKNIFEQFNLYNHKYYEAKLIVKGQELKYYWLNILTCPLEMVDFEKSEFVLADLDDQPVDKINISSAQGYRKAFDDRVDKTLGIIPTKLFLTQMNQNRPYDLLYFKLFHLNMIISDSLKNEIEKQNITGFTFKEQSFY